MENTRVIVIGAGIVGVCTAMACRRLGMSVTLVDRLAPGEACSYGNAGVLASWSCVPFPMPGIARNVPGWLLDRKGPLKIRWSRFPGLVPWFLRFLMASNLSRAQRTSDAMFALNHLTVERYKTLAAEAGAPELIRESDYIYVFDEDVSHDFDELQWQLRRAKGATIAALSAGELREREPDLSYAYKSAISLGPQGYTTNPQRLVQVIAGLFERQGGEVVRSEVGRLSPLLDGGVAVETASGEMVADKVVVAAGAWSHRLVGPLGLRIPLATKRGYHVSFANSGISLSNTIMETRHHVVGTDMENGLRIAGTVEFTGPDDTPDWSRAENLVEVARKMFPGADLSRKDVWSGPRPVLPDDLPAIGPVPDCPDVVTAFGHGHLGLTGAPETGEIVSSMIAGRPINTDVAPYDPARF